MVSSGRPLCSLIERRRSFSYAMEELGQEEEARSFCVEEAGTGQRRRRYLEELWKDAERIPTAFLVENDVMGIAVYRALKSNGLRVPEDVSVIGFDGRSICSMLEPSLTTLRVPRRLMGRLLVRLLLEKIELQNRASERVTVRLEINAETGGDGERCGCASDVNLFKYKFFINYIDKFINLFYDKWRVETSSTQTGAV